MQACRNPGGAHPVEGAVQDVGDLTTLSWYVGPELASAKR